MSSQARLGDVVSQPFAPEGCHKEAQRHKMLEKPFVLFVPFCGEDLFHRYGLREIAWLVHVAPATHRDVIREQL